MSKSGSSNGGASGPSPDPDAFDANEEKRVIETNLTGRVKRFDRTRAFGFIVRDDNGEDLFMHQSSIWRFDLEPDEAPYFDEDQIVCFDLAIGRKGLEAINITELTNLATRDPRWRLREPVAPQPSNRQSQTSNASAGGRQNNATSSSASANAKPPAKSNTTAAKPQKASANQATTSAAAAQPGGSANEEKSPMSPGLQKYLIEMGFYEEDNLDFESGDEETDDVENDPDSEVSYPEFLRCLRRLKRSQNRAKAKEQSEAAAAALKASQPESQAASAIPPQSELKSVQEPDDPMCRLCVDEPAVITFHPCNHKVCCLDCAYRLKKCPKCEQMIEKKTQENGRELIVEVGVKVSELMTRFKDLEEARTCPICLEKTREVVFDCGHSVCQDCSKKVPQECPFCRKKIKRRIKLY